MTTVTTPQRQQPIRSTIPARLDRLRWSPFHTRLVLGLGTAWVLDGLSITIASSVSSKLTQPDTLNLTTTQAASIGTVYLVGEVIGALVFGRLSDQLGRRSLFMWTLAIYLVGTALTALTPKGTGWIYYLYATRLVAGMGIGGEYSAINSAIDEMMPARYRGRTDIWINGTYWLGAILGTFASFLLLNSLPTRDGWRVAFLCGPALAVVIIFVRRNLPESPRWLITHGRAREAEEQMRRIEEIAQRDGQRLDPVPDSAAIMIKPERRFGYLTLLRVAFRVYPRRAVLGATLMITQSFLYNAIFFTYALVLTKFYHVSNNAVPLYGLAFAVGNLACPLLLGHLFDSLGRKKMISGTYLISGVLLAASAWLFDAGVLHAAAQTFIWIIVFFFASAGASAGYLTVSEIFPIEIRAEALAVFFAIAQVVGAVGPAFYGFLIGNGTNRTGLTIGYIVGGGIMIIGGLVELAFGVNAEGKSLEEVAAPLTEVGSSEEEREDHDRCSGSRQLGGLPHRPAAGRAGGPLAAVPPDRGHRLRAAPGHAGRRLPGGHHAYDQRGSGDSRVRAARHGARRARRPGRPGRPAGVRRAGRARDHRYRPPDQCPAHHPGRPGGQVGRAGNGQPVCPAQKQVPRHDRPEREPGGPGPAAVTGPGRGRAGGGCARPRCCWWPHSRRWSSSRR